MNVTRHCGGCFVTPTPHLPITLRRGKDKASEKEQTKFEVC